MCIWTQGDWGQQGDPSIFLFLLKKTDVIHNMPVDNIMKVKSIIASNQQEG